MRGSHVIAAAALVAASLTGYARAAEDSPEDIKSEINALQRRLAAIEAKEQAASTSAAVQMDAGQRSQLLQTQGFTAGYDKGFKIQSADGKFLLQPGIQFQFRNITNFADTADGDNFENGFEYRRIRLRLDGNAFSKNLKYSFVWDSNRNGGGTSLLDAWGSYTFDGTPYTIKVGQFRSSWNHEGDVSDTRQLAVERSLVDQLLGGSQTDRVQGAEFIYGKTDLPVRAVFGFTDGDNSKNTDFRDSDGAPSSSRTESNFGAHARVEYKVFGDWSAYSDFTAKGAKEDLLVLGGALTLSENGDSDTWRATVDAQYENTLGWSAYGALFYVEAENAASETNFGGVAQVGYLINPNVEVFGRYSGIILDDDVAGEDTLHEITVGGNYYFGEGGSWGHNVKFTLDLNYLPNGVPSNVTGAGYLAGTDEQFALRAQFQITF